MKTYRGENPEQHLVEFLKEIDAEAIRKYERIDELFVPPIEYDNIRNSLRKNRIIFLTGTKEYGKTYVAVSLLWEYFKEGYNLLWFKGDRDEDRSRTRSNLLNIQKYLKPSHIIYFEDPFGKTKYEATDDEALTKNIGSIIDTVTVSDDAYVIITSREEVFKEFKQRVSVETDLNKFEKRLIMKGPSYDFKRRSQMLLNWAKVMRCKWLQDEDLTHIILEAMKDDRILSTPLNIEQFALATVNVSTRDKLLEKVQSKSRDTPRSFADEIKLMSKDKILFFSFLFISSWWETRFVESRYNSLVIKLRLEGPQKFSTLTEWFKDDKISIRHGTIGFSHDSFSEALEYLLEENGNPSSISVQVFSKVLLDLLKFENLTDIIRTIIWNIEFLPLSFIRIPTNRLGKRKARQLLFNTLLTRNKFYNQNNIELLSLEDKLFLYCVINNKPDKKVVVDEKIRWKNIWGLILFVEKQFKYNESEKFLSAISLCPEIANTKSTEYFEKIFENAIEFKIRKIVRETYFVATRDVFSLLKTDPNILEIRSRFNFDEMNKDYFIKILRNLVDSHVIRPSMSGNMLRSTRKLAESVYSSKELDIHQRVVQHIGYIIKYMATPLLYRIEVKAISYAQKLKNHYLLEGKESLSIAAVLSFIASRELGIKNSAKYISDETGVSKSYLYTHYREFMSITSNPK